MDEFPDDVALEALQYSWRRRDWVRRRTIAYSFASADLLQRELKLQLGLSLSELPKMPNGDILLPLADVERAAPNNLSFTMGGREVDTLMREEERGLIASAIALLADQTGDVDDPNDFRDSVLASLDSPYVRPFPPEFPQWMGYLDGHDDLRELVDTYTGQRVVIGRFAARELRSNATISGLNTERLVLERSSPIKLASALRNSLRPEESTFAAWQSVGSEWQLVVANGSATGISRTQSNTGPPVKEFRKAWRRPWLFRDIYVANIWISELVEARSLTLTMDTPPGVYLDDATLRVFHFDGHTSSLIIIADDDDEPGAAHVHFSTNHLGLPAEPADFVEARLRIILRPTYHNGLRSGRNLLLAAAAVSWILFATYGWQRAGWDCVVCGDFEIAESNADAMVSLVVLAPSIAMGLYLRGDADHLLTKRVQAGYRTRLAASGVLSFVLALAVALNFKDGVNVAWLCLIVASAQTVLLALTQASATRSRRRCG